MNLKDEDNCSVNTNHKKYIKDFTSEELRSMTINEFSVTEELDSIITRSLMKGLKDAHKVMNKIAKEKGFKVDDSLYVRHLLYEDW